MYWLKCRKSLKKVMRKPCHFPRLPFRLLVPLPSFPGSMPTGESTPWPPQPRSKPTAAKLDGRCCKLPRLGPRSKGPIATLYTILTASSSTSILSTNSRMMSRHTENSHVSNCSRICLKIPQACRLSASKSPRIAHDSRLHSPCPRVEPTARASPGCVARIPLY